MACKITYAGVDYTQEQFTEKIRNNDVPEFKIYNDFRQRGMFREGENIELFNNPQFNDYLASLRANGTKVLTRNSILRGVAFMGLSPANQQLLKEFAKHLSPNLYIRLLNTEEANAEFGDSTKMGSHTYRFKRGQSQDYIKPGVEELFDSNPELANQVYEALGFQGNINLESNLKNTGKTEKELIKYLKEKYPEIKLTITNNPIWEKESNIVKNQDDITENFEEVSKLLSKVFVSKIVINNNLKTDYRISGNIIELRKDALYKNTTLLITNIIKNEILTNDKYKEFITIEEDLEKIIFKVIENKITTFDLDKYNNVFFQKLFELLDNIIKKITKYINSDYNKRNQIYLKNELLTLNLSDFINTLYFNKILLSKNIEVIHSDNYTDDNYYNYDTYYSKIPDFFVKDIINLTEINNEENEDLYKYYYDKLLQELQEFQIDKEELDYVLNTINDLDITFKNYQNNYNKGLTNIDIKTLGIIEKFKQNDLKIVHNLGSYTQRNKESILNFWDTLNNGTIDILSASIIKKGRKLHKYRAKGTANITFKDNAEIISYFPNDSYTTRSSDNKIVYQHSYEIFDIDEAINIEKRTEDGHHAELLIKFQPQFIDTFEIIDKVMPDYLIKMQKKYGFLVKRFEINNKNKLELKETIDNFKTTESVYNQVKENKTIGQANIKAMTVLVDAVNKKADTIPHEYAHHYIAWFRDTPIVQEGIKRFGSEEALVQAIGEQVVKQKGEAYNWWKKFTNWILNLLSDKQLLQILTDSFLNRQNLNEFSYNQIIPQQKQQALQVYSQYLDTIFPNSKVKDIVYHGTPNTEIQSFLSPEKEGYKKQETTTTGVAGIYFSNKKEVADLYQDFKKEGVKGKTYSAVINTKRPLIVGDKATDGFTEGTFGASALWNIQKGVLQGLRKAGIDAIKTGDYASKTSAVGENVEIAVFEPEQIHILGSKQDIEGFKEFVGNLSEIDQEINSNLQEGETSVIKLRVDGNATEMILMHELAHSAFDRYLDLYNKEKKNPSFKSNMTDEQRQAVKNIINLYKRTKQLVGKKSEDTYGFKNVNEFVAEFLSNPVFRDDLRKIEDNTDGKPESLFNKIVSYLLSLFKGTIGEKIVYSIAFNLLSITKTSKVDAVDSIERSKQNETNKVNTDEKFTKAKEFLDNLAKIKVEKKDDKTTFNGVPITGVTNFIKEFIVSPRFRDEYDAENDASTKWDDRNIPVDEKLDTIYGRIDKEEYIAKSKERHLRYKNLGKLAHLLIEKKFLPVNVRTSEIQSKINDLLIELGGRPEQAYAWIVNSAKAHLENIHVDNTSTIYSELPTFDDVLGIGGIMDSLILYNTGELGIVDFKTGNGFASRFTDEVLKYGNQFVDITANPRDKAQLQIMLYAMTIKANLPEATFTNLYAAWISSDNYVTYDHKAAVPVDSMLNMIKKFLKNEKPEIYKKLLEKSPNIFKKEDYNTIARSELNPNPNQDPLNELVEAKNKLTSLIAKNPKTKVFGEQKTKKIRDLTQRIIDLEKTASSMPFAEMDLKAQSERFDISPFEASFGNYSESKNPYLQVFKRIQDEGKMKAKREANRTMLEFYKLLQPVLREYYKKTGQEWKSDLSIGQLLRNIKTSTKDNTGFWDFIWSENDKNGLVQEGLITEKDSKYQTLTKDQKAVVEYMRKTFKDAFVGENAVMNRKMVEIGRNKWLTNFDIVKKKHSMSSFEITDDFMPRYTITNQEMKERFGFLSKENFEFLRLKNLSYYFEDVHEQWTDTEEIIPFKGMPTDYLKAERRYTRNGEIIMDQFVRNITLKKYLDDVWAVGTGLQILLKMKGADSLTGNPFYKNTISFLENKMLLDILDQKRKEMYSSDSIRIPMLRMDRLTRFGKGKKNPEKPEGPDNYIKYKTISVSKVIRSLKNYASATTMWMMPIGGLRNGVFISLANMKEAIKGSIADTKLIGVDNNVVDFTWTDLQSAWAVVLNMEKQRMFGNVRSNKLWILEKKFGYLPGNFDWASNNDSLLTTYRPLFNTSTMYSFYSIPEEMNSLVIMVAQMKRMKNQATGQTIWDSYSDPIDLGNGVYDVIWQGGIRGYERTQSGDLREVSELTALEVEKMKRVYQRVHGAYRRDERVAFEAYALGEVFMQFKKYLHVVLRGALMGKGFTQGLGYFKPTGEKLNGVDILTWENREIEGRWRTMFNVILQYMQLKNDNTYKLSELSPDQKLQLIDGLSTFMFVLFIFAAGAMLFDDDDEWFNSKDSFAQFLRVVMMNFSQHWNPLDIYDTVFSVPAAAKKPHDLLWYGTKYAYYQMMFSATGDDKYLTQDKRVRNQLQFIKAIPLLNSAQSLNKFMQSTKFLSEGEVKYNDAYEWMRVK